MKVHVDMKKCICAGMCVTIAPSLFDLDDNNKLVVKKSENLNEAEQKEAADAVACCPVEAIEIR